MNFLRFMHGKPMGGGPLPKAAPLLLLCLFLVLNVHAEAQAALRRSAVVNAVEKASPAVVNISTVSKERVGAFFPFSGQEFFRDFFPEVFPREYTRTSLGSGVIFNGTEGYVVTNHHVVAEAAAITVITSDQTEFTAKLLGSDPRSDLAVLAIEVEEKMPEIDMGASDDLMIGETVVAIGNPFGLSHTVTTGVVSALNRSVRSGDHVYRNLIQTDASINPGNSGGPLLNIEGDLIGINTAIYQKAQGIGFAIPIEKVKRIVRELIQSGHVRFPWLGVEIQELTAELKNYFNFPSDRGGVLTSHVIQGSPGAQAGVKRGDIVMALGGMLTVSPQAYRQALSEFTPGGSIELKIFREGDELSIPAKPTAFPVELALDLASRNLGIEVAEISAATRKQYGIEGGVSIERVVRNSAAGRVGLKPGDLIYKVNDMPIKNLDDFREAISRYHHQNALNLIVRRGGYVYSLKLPF
ncbi:MAG: Do family serine endopeptidase [Desulfatiglandaceae bacterium]